MLSSAFFFICPWELPLCLCVHVPPAMQPASVPQRELWTHRVTQQMVPWWNTFPLPFILLLSCNNLELLEAYFAWRPSAYPWKFYVQTGCRVCCNFLRMPSVWNKEICINYTNWFVQKVIVLFTHCLLVMLFVNNWKIVSKNESISSLSLALVSFPLSQICLQEDFHSEMSLSAFFFVKTSLYPADRINFNARAVTQFEHS